MFYNPGGPGGSGTLFIIQEGEQLQTQLGEGWDILSWDPRGIMKSGPDIAAFDTDEEYYSYWSQYQGLGKISARGNLTQPTDVDFFMSQVPAFDNLTTALNQRMVQKNGEKLKYVGTCANVRDLVHLVDSAYGEGSDVNFWGVSYGTVLGAYLTQMFPDRVGRVILDAVYDPEKHSNQAPIKWVDTDSLNIDQGLLMWAQACVAGPASCTAAGLVQNATAELLLQEIDEVLDTAHRRYNGFAWTTGLINETVAMNADSYSWEYLAGIVRGALYNSRVWRVLAEGLVQITQLQQNRTSKTTGPIFPVWFTPQYGLVPDYFLDTISVAIYCSDTIDPAGETTEDLFRAYVKASQSISTLSAAIVSQNMRSHCHKYTTRAIERLPQSMKKKPKNVVLVIGNTGDPITPFQSARRLSSSAFLGSQARLLQFNAAGHGAHALNSTCIDEVVRKFVRGIPPNDAGNNDADVVCDVDMTPYGPPPAEWKNSTPPTSSEETTVTGDANMAKFSLKLSFFALVFATITIF
ncbi:hypothetical protein PIIN_06902 [Serendipita indica DSM 11827]|uniref:Peptidase S33 tripeptidyl aminopeptidase-like C-terminal domain-containing protein n=1 Tax=Serendipita indica (strain DSM 11827) TaxID=1109443 RepID=G4TNQ4_SERID|nr:hypothetical protein PIIN_06902 [Serendipita indica DSM 11827]